MHGNSFEKKLAIVKGSTPITESPNRGIQKTHSRHGFMEQTSVSRELFITSPGQSNENSSPEDVPSESPSWAKEPTNSPAKLEAMVIGDNEENCDADNELQTFPYELLKVSSGTALAGIDVTRREAYLSIEDFKVKFGMNKKAFYKLPKWKQNKLKQALNLF